MIVQDNHIAGAGFIPVSDGFIQKRSRRRRCNNRIRKINRLHHWCHFHKAQINFIAKRFWTDQLRNISIQFILHCWKPPTPFIKQQVPFNRHTFPFTILNLLLYYSCYFSYKTIYYRIKVIGSYNYGYRYL